MSEHNGFPFASRSESRVASDWFFADVPDLIVKAPLVPVFDFSLSLSWLHFLSMHLQHLYLVSHCQKYKTPPSVPLEKYLYKTGGSWVELGDHDGAPTVIEIPLHGGLGNSIRGDGEFFTNRRDRPSKRKLRVMAPKVV